MLTFKSYRDMKKLVYIFMIAAVLVSCKKNTTENQIAPAPLEPSHPGCIFLLPQKQNSPPRIYSMHFEDVC